MTIHERERQEKTVIHVEIVLITNDYRKQVLTTCTVEEAKAFFDSLQEARLTREQNERFEKVLETKFDEKFKRKS